MNQFKIDKEQILVDTYLPHNFLAEKMILSCLLTDPESIEIIVNDISSEVFYFKNHQEIYKAIVFMYKNKQSVDILTLNSFLQENGLLKKVGGIQVLSELIHQIPNLTYLEEYIYLIKDKFVRRALIKLGYKIIGSGYTTNIPLETIINNLESEILNLTIQTNQKEEQKMLSSAELLSNTFFELKDKFLNPAMPGLSSGFSSLDSLIQGFQKSDLIILAGRPSTGKTALSLNITLNVLKNSNLPVLFFSLEMSKEQLIYRLLSIETNINQTILRNGKLSRDDWNKLNKIIKVISKFPLFMDDTPGLSIQNIRSRIKIAMSKQSKIGLVIIDYLQLMQNSELQNDNRVQELSRITRSLKNIAREFNIPIIALSQLSRNVENRVDQKPILSDLRESGSIEQDADLVLMLSKIKSTNVNPANNFIHPFIELIVAKHRNGPTGTIQLKFNKEQMIFSDIESS